MLWLRYVFREQIQSNPIGGSFSSKLVCAAISSVIAAMISLAQPLRADQSLPAPPPQKIQELIELLRDPALANWLVEETKAKAAQDAVRPPPTLQQRLEEKLRAGRGRVVSALNGFGLLGFELEMARSKIAWLAADRGLHRTRSRLPMGGVQTNAPLLG